MNDLTNSMDAAFASDFDSFSPADNLNGLKLEYADLETNLVSNLRSYESLQARRRHTVLAFTAALAAFFLTLGAITMLSASNVETTDQWLMAGIAFFFGTVLFSSVQYMHRGIKYYLQSSDLKKQIKNARARRSMIEDKMKIVIG